MHNQATPWFPIPKLPQLPQLPCGIEVIGAPEQVSLRVIYTFYGGDRDLLIDLQAEVFGCWSELAAHPVTIPDDYPRLKHTDYASHIWPLMEVTGSTWLASHIDRLAMPVEDYRHYRIVSDDGTFDALVSGSPFARWAPTGR